MGGLASISPTTHAPGGTGARGMGCGMAAASMSRDAGMAGQGIPGMHTGWPAGAIGGGGGGTHIPGIPGMAIIGCGATPGGRTRTLAALLSRSVMRAMIRSSNALMACWQAQVFMAQQHLPEQQHLLSLAQAVLQQHLQSLAQAVLQQHLQS